MKKNVYLAKAEIRNISRDFSVYFYPLVSA